METKSRFFFRLTLLSILVSITITFILLFEYTIEYHAPAILSGRIIIPFTYFIFMLLAPLTVSVFFNSEKIFNTVFKITAVFMLVLILIGGVSSKSYWYSTKDNETLQKLLQLKNLRWSRSQLFSGLI